MSQPTRCAHPSCGCPPAPDSPGGGYCSAYCANAAESEPLPGESGPMPDACSCGHEACRRAQERHTRGREPKTSVGENP